MDTEAQRIKAETKKLPFKKRLSNFWYYYRIHIIVAIITILILGLSFRQCSMIPDYDMTVAVCMKRMVENEKLTELSELLKTQCKDITEDNEVNVGINPTFADITTSTPDEKLMAVLVKLQGGLASNQFAGYIVDEAFKNYIVQTCEYPEEDVIEITDIPQIRQCLTPADGEKLYWLTGFDRRTIDGQITQYDNGKRVEQFFLD